MTAVFERDRERAMRVKDSALPLFYGGCGGAEASGGELRDRRNVVEHVELWPSLCADKKLSLEQRIHIAANALELVHFFDNYPTTTTPSTSAADDDGVVVVRRRVVATRLSALAFGINAYYVPKLLLPDAIGLEPYERDAPLLSALPCVTDADCMHALLVQHNFLPSCDSRDVCAAIERVRSLLQPTRSVQERRRAARGVSLRRGGAALRRARLGRQPDVDLPRLARTAARPRRPHGARRASGDGVVTLAFPQIPLHVDPKRAHVLTSVVTACQFQGADAHRSALASSSSRLARTAVQIAPRGRRSASCKRRCAARSSATCRPSLRRTTPTWRTISTRSRLFSVSVSKRRSHIAQHAHSECCTTRSATALHAPASSPTLAASSRCRPSSRTSLDTRRLRVALVCSLTTLSVLQNAGRSASRRCAL